MTNALGRIEAVLDEPDLAAAIGALEAALPLGARRRQLAVRTLLVGMLGCLAEGHQNAYLSGVHAVLVGLDDADKWRLGVRVAWRGGPHEVTYRQVEYTAHLLERVLRKERPNGAPSAALQVFCDRLLEASIPAAYKDASRAYAIDWTDVESFSRPPGEPDGPCADPEAAWGHRRGDGPGQKHELFFGYYDSLMTMVPEPGAAAIPELIRRAQLVSCRVDPVPGFVGVVVASAANGVVIEEVLADSGYSYKVPGHFAYPLRAAGMHLVVDLHPNDRGPKGTFAGAILANGNLFCPKTPPALLSLGPLARAASVQEAAAHDTRRRRAVALQARAPQCRRRRRLSPRRVSRRDGQGPLPAVGTLDGAFEQPTRDLRGARAPAAVLHATQRHRPPGGQRQDPSEARLSLRGAPPFLWAAQRRRACQLPAQGPRGHQRLGAGLVQTDGARPVLLVPRLRVCRRELRPGRLLRGAAGRSGTPGRDPSTTTAPSSTAHPG